MADPLSPGADLAKVYGEETRCPACGAFARVVPHDELRWVCGVCGAPRVVMPEGEKLPEEAAVALREATAAQRAAAFNRIISYVTTAPAVIGILLAIVLAPASFLASGVLIGMGIVLAVLALRASRRGATERKRIRTAVERAHEAAIGALSSKKLSPAEVATALRIPEAEVEAALAVRIALPEPEPEPEEKLEKKL